MIRPDTPGHLTKSPTAVVGIRPGPIGNRQYADALDFRTALCAQNSTAMHQRKELILLLQVTIEFPRNRAITKVGPLVFDTILVYL